MRRFWQRNQRLMASLALTAAILVVWAVTVEIFQVRKFIVPPPGAVIADLAENWRYFIEQAWHTVWATLVGFALAMVIGLTLAIGIAYSRILDLTLYTLLVALNSIPKVAVAPLFVIWLGAGLEPKIAIAMLIAIFSIVIDAVLGLRSVDPDALALARVSRASALQVLFKIRLPSALPSIFAGIKAGISFALIGTIVGEFVVGERGLGATILMAQGMFNTTRAFAAILLLAIIGLLLFFALEILERYLLPWHVSQRATSPNASKA